MQNDILTQLVQKGRLLRQNQKTWDEISQALNILTEDGRLNPGLAKRIVEEGYVPARARTRSRLGLSPRYAVALIGGGDIPEGTQAIQACSCTCGQYFISNHPRRIHCFICRPFRQRAARSGGNIGVNNARENPHV
jgi:hypothetical protein